MIIIQDRIVSLQIAHLRWKVAVRSLLLVKITRIYKTLPARQSHYLLVAIHFCILVKQPRGWRHNLGGIGFYSSLARHYLPPQYLKFQTKQIDLPIRSINFLLPEFQAAYRAPSLTLAVAEYPPGPLTGVSADAEFPLQWHA